MWIETDRDQPARARERRGATIADPQVSDGGAGPISTLCRGRLRTADLDEAEARQAYLDQLDGILETEFLAPFAASLDAFHLDRLSVLRATATPRRSIRLASRIAHDHYDSICVQYVVAGSATGEANGRPVDSSPGSIMLLDYGQPFAVTDLEPRSVINVAVPRATFPGRRVDPSAWHGAVLTGGAAAPLAAFMHQLYDTLDAMPPPAGAMLAEAFGRLLVVALGDYETADIAAHHRNARVVERAMQLVDHRIGSPDLDPAWLAARLGLSRSDLYAAMEEFGGVARFIMKRRLTAARTALEDPSDTRRIGVIAYAYGFSSEAHFSRAFRGSFGAAPRDVRRQTIE